MVSIASVMTLESLLIQIAEELQLPPYLDENVREHYRALASYLEQCPSLARYNPKLYAQGSFRIGTTVRPVNREEFDLDFICEVALSSAVSPQDVFNLVAEAIEGNAIYEDKFERKPRCIRVTFADDCHVDIVPAVPVDDGSEAIYIPNRNGQAWAWHSTNPKGYVRWFTARCLDVTAAGIKSVVRASIEPLPEYRPLQTKAALQIGVQLGKRNHQLNVEDESLRSPSIVFTTIAGKECSGRPLIVATFDKLVRVLRDEYAAYPAPQHVLHPAHAGEMVSEKWKKPDVYQQFRDYVDTLDRQWAAVQAAEGQGLAKLAAALYAMFGEKPVTAAMNSLGEKALKLTNDRQIRTVTGGGLVVVERGLGNPRKNFHGDV